MGEQNGKTVVCEGWGGGARVWSNCIQLRVPSQPVRSDRQRLRCPQLVKRVVPETRYGRKRARNHCAALAERVRRQLEQRGAAERRGEEEIHSVKLQNSGGEGG